MDDWLQKSGNDDLILGLLFSIMVILIIWVNNQKIATWWQKIKPSDFSWILSCLFYGICGLIALFLIVGIIGLALIGWDRVLELFK